MSRRPKCASARLTASATAGRWPTSAVSARHRRPSASTRRCVSRGGWRSRAATSAPTPASASAIACPMPRPAPVTRATCPARSGGALVGVLTMLPPFCSTLLPRTTYTFAEMKARSLTGPGAEYPTLEALADRLQIRATDHGIRRLAPGRGGDQTTARGQRHARQARRELREYLAGRRTRFSVAADLRGLPEFRARVLAATRRIPFGHVISYRSEEHTSELQSLAYLVCRLLLEKKKNEKQNY